MKLNHLAEMIEKNNENSIEIEANSLEDALKRGADSLKTSIINLDYEIIEKGKKGFLGLGKKNFVVRIWKTGEIDLGIINQSLANQEAEREEIELNLPRDGEGKVKIKRSGVFLKVIPPKNGGVPAELKAIENLLFKRGIHHFDRRQVKDILKKSDESWVKIGEWVPNPEYDSKITISVAADEMEASITMSAPIYSGRTLEPEEIINALESEGVKYGILYDKIREIADDEIVNIPIVVAQGIPPKHGRDSEIAYKFKTGFETGPLFDKEEEVVDYRELNRVQNVLAGQIIAEKIPAGRGEYGRTVKNKVIEARDGKDYLFRVGKNVRLSEDGFTAYAQKDGQVFLSGGELVVREIYEVRGDLDYNVGNIDFVGTVIIHGDVKENFLIKAAGDVFIVGSFYRSEIIAQGKVIAKGGIKGGKIKAGRSIYSKYIDNANLEAGLDVIASEEIMNCDIKASGRVICITGKGGIIGGRVIAALQIIAKKLGAESYTGTLLEAGVDPSIKLKLSELEKEKKTMDEKFDTLLTSLERIETEKKEQGLSPKKEKILKKMIAARMVYSKKLAFIEDKIKKLSIYLSNLENKGSISSRYITYPGVKVTIKNAEMEIKNEYKSVTFKYSAGHIVPSKYEFNELDKEIRQEIRKLKDREKG